MALQAARAGTTRPNNLRRTRGEQTTLGERSVDVGEDLFTIKTHSLSQNCVKMMRVNRGSGARIQWEYL